MVDLNYEEFRAEDDRAKLLDQLTASLRKAKQTIAEKDAMIEGCMKRIEDLESLNKSVKWAFEERGRLIDNLKERGYKEG